MTRFPSDALSGEVAEHAVEGLHWFDVDRRRFLRILGGGVLVCAATPAVTAAAQESGRTRAGRDLPSDLSAWIHVDADGRVTVCTGKVEMGQNIRTSLSQQVAEELRVPVGSIDMVMGDTDRTPYDMGTFGSRTTPTMGPQLRKAAAAARELFLDMAAESWKADRSALAAEGGKILDRAAGRSISFGDLARGKELVRSIDSSPALAPAAGWRVAGTSVSKVDGRAFVTGTHRYTSDLSRPGMLHGKVLRPGGFRGRLASLDASAAEDMPGVRVVRDGDFVGVTAPAAWDAERAIEAIRARWTVPEQPSEEELWEVLKKKTESGDRSQAETAGSVEEARAAADVKLSATYRVAYIAHAPLEPRAAVAEWNGDKLMVWTGTQRPFAVKDELAEAFRIPAEQVRVLVPDTGSAYGGKHTGDAAVEAARLSRATGKPVKVVWTREEEFTWAYFRPAGVIEIASGARKDGEVTSWEFHNYNSGPAAIATPYTVANRKIQFHPADGPLRQGSYRGLAATANHFARESHMDELAQALSMDSLQFRLKNLKDERLKAVLQSAADKFGWGATQPAAGSGFGIACGVEKGGYIATCAAVEIEPSTRRVILRRVVQAFECGAVVNPGGLRNQIEGAVVQAIGGALFEAVRFAGGKISNPHFSLYRVPRFPDVPRIDVVILDRKDLPSAGAGETPLVGLAPAIGNAIFAATGVRLRSLPLAPRGVPSPA
ncbi:MAG TPA: molybdopterin cofactor-binding domain-containing protein [Thermoanaerobaculia bacterium]|nr:molybdopterin cofactor-binding domain-containing protein [Thermoanaerobaculia bacterium]